MVTGRNNFSHEIFPIHINITYSNVSKFQNTVVLILYFFQVKHLPEYRRGKFSLLSWVFILQSIQYTCEELCSWNLPVQDVRGVTVISPHQGSIHLFFCQTTVEKHQFKWPWEQKSKTNWYNFCWDIAWIFASWNQVSLFGHHLHIPFKEYF